MKLAKPEERYVTKLGVSYSAYALAVHNLVKDWLDGKCDNHPVHMSDNDCANIVSHCYKTLPNTDAVDEKDVNRASERLVELGVFTHFKTVTTHRKWVKRAYLALRASGVDFQDTEEMARLVEVHDLSKYTPAEVLGYTIKFGGGGGFRALDDPDDVKEWELSLESHFGSNPHHPQYFVKESLTGLAKTGLNVSDQEHGKTFLEEGILDMLACRGERDLKDDAEFSLKKWLAIPGQFLGRYSVADREWVSQKLREWTKVTLAFNANHCDATVSQVITEGSAFCAVVP